MKTLKKVLSLVLVVAMVASMCIVGAAAAEDTKYDEAVAVVTGLGIIEGDGTGYNFTGEVTREQAAKMIAYMLLGKDVAESLKTGTAPFADVAANRWSAGYIAYLKGQGIISGVSDTEFDPTANVTGIAFAKMLLTAIGYGKAGEFEGAAWDINTITFANQEGIFAGSLTASPANAATREEAMLYLFNALQVPTVNYNKTFESYYVGTSPLQSVEEDKEVEYSLGYLNYKLIKVSTPETTDDFGRPAASWNANGTAIAATVATATPDAVLYGKVNSGALYNAIGKTVADAINKGVQYGEITVTIDGAPNAYTFTNPIKAGYTTDEFTNYGATTEVYVSYADGKYSVNVVVWYEYIGTVTKVNKTANTITVDTADFTISGEALDITGLAKNDVVIFTQGASAVASIAKAEPVVGTYINDTFFTFNIDGVSVYESEHSVSSPSEYGRAYEIYYDAQGNILKAVEFDSDEASGAYQYLYVKGSQAQVKGSDLLYSYETKVAYDVVYATGGQEIVLAAVRTDATGDYVVVNGEKKYVTEDVAADFVAEGWYSYTVNDDGYVTIKNLATNSYATEKAAIDVETGKAGTGTGFAANSKTVLTIVNEDGNSVTYTGIASFPELAGDYEVIVTHAKAGTLAKSIVVYYGDKPVGTTKNYAYVSMALNEDAENVTYMAWIDGAMQYITVSKDNLLGGASAYTMFSVCEVETKDGEYVVTLPASGVVNAGKYNFNAYTGAQQWFEEATIDSVDENYFTTVEVAVEGGMKSPDELVVLDEGQYVFDLSIFGVPGVYQVKNDDDGVAGPSEFDTTDEAKTAQYMEIIAHNKAAEGMSDTYCGYNVDSKLYYYDNDTVIYDCVNGGIATELNAGDSFLAVMDTEDPTLCAYIWIVA